MREKDINLLFHLFMHSLVDSCLGPDPVLDPQPWHIRTTLKPAELPGQGKSSLEHHFLLMRFCFQNKT